MDIVLTQRRSFVELVATSEILNSQSVLFAIEYLKTALKHYPRRAALMEFVAPKQQLRLWELPGQWRGVLATFPHFTRIAYVITGRAFDDNIDFSQYFTHNGAVSGRLFYNRRDAQEWLNQGDPRRLRPALEQSPRMAVLDNASLAMHVSDWPVTDQLEH